MPGVFGPTSQAPVNNKPLRLYDATLEKHTDLPQAMKSLNTTFQRMEKILQPFVLSAVLSSTVTITGRFTVGTLVRENMNLTATIADASKQIQATSMVVQQMAGDKAIVAPGCSLNLPLLNVPLTSGFVPLFLGNNGNITPTEPAYGFVQVVGYIRLWDQSRGLYTVVFQQTPPVWKPKEVTP